jgi:hypothetical protein
LDLNSLNLVHKYAVKKCSDSLNRAVVLTYPCSNGRVLEEGKSRHHQVRLIKWEGQVKAGITISIE